METREYSPFKQVHEHVREALLYATPGVKPGGMIDRLAFYARYGKGIRREIQEAIVETPDNFLSDEVAERLADVTEGRVEAIWMGRRGANEVEVHNREKSVKDDLQRDILTDAVRPKATAPTLQERALLAEGPIWEFAGILAQALASQSIPEAFNWGMFFEKKVLMPFFHKLTKN